MMARLRRAMTSIAACAAASLGIATPFCRRKRRCSTYLNPLLSCGHASRITSHAVATYAAGHSAPRRRTTNWKSSSMKCPADSSAAASSASDCDALIRAPLAGVGRAGTLSSAPASSCTTIEMTDSGGHASGAPCKERGATTRAGTMPKVFDSSGAAGTVSSCPRVISSCWAGGSSSSICTALRTASCCGAGAPSARGASLMKAAAAPISATSARRLPVLARVKKLCGPSGASETCRATSST
mmetsp:Transcript_31948/g.98937  ORF Transcript_31948/g.98937 Transcript_31948/m.98937 type:complete len:242 (+) Transcript_31948:236-961(+)